MKAEVESAVSLLLRFAVRKITGNPKNFTRKIEYIKREEQRSPSDKLFVAGFEAFSGINLEEFLDDITDLLSEFEQQNKEKIRETKAPPRFKAYEVLGINEKATEAEIMSAFRKKAMLAHPDKGGSKEAMIELIKAREVCLENLRRRR